ncbi:hypothetical protein BCR41DRAFT_67509 [Lobosporangium transversale]|uniref:Uncharacterized protein n=1 Tax=Lobosporangium transversale TaxID=64571 RepID=A0A1Y2H0Q7_9FUNG|nr:hypothetical protein BCR41DRAFT_67509 [Lobosporangium transversale]ORZ28139.1 hypothetical protein BCR41DRAFT_67509 [Lobosporangium transversale]|eukprot:XP_021885824.1 hypothetical protein BCR41DRAFT_67509 [Lobosporangium transversale]
MQKQAMAMGMQYIKQAIQMLQNLAFDLYKKSQSGSSSSSLADKDAGTPSTRSATSISSFGTVATSSAFSGTSTDASANINAPSAQGYFSWAYHALSPKLAAVASMAASSSVPSVSLLDKGSARPLPVPPVDLYANRTPSTGSASSSSSNSDESKKTELDQLTSRLNRAAELSSLRNRKISLYDDENNNSGSETSSVNHSAHTSESYTTTWGSNFTSFGHNY